MADLIDNDIAFAVAAQLEPLMRRFDGVPPLAFLRYHPDDFVLTGPRLLYHGVVAAREFGKLKKEINKRNHTGRGGFFRHPTSGFAEVCWELLGDPYTREECLQAFSVPHEKLSGDEYLARAIALEWTTSELPKIFTPEVDTWIAWARDEICFAQMFHEKGYEDDAREYLWKAWRHVEWARVIGARLVVRHLGWSLDRDYCLRAARTLANLVTYDLGLMTMKERQARDLCGW